MHFIKIHKIIALIISLFHLIGFWHRGDKPTARELRVKFFYFIYYWLFVLSIVVGTINSENQETTIFLTEASITSGVYGIRLWIIFWQQNEILDLVNRICEFSVRDDESREVVKDKLKGFILFVIVFLIALTISFSLEAVIFPFFGNENTLFIEIGFPLDWRSSDVAFWIASIFTFTELLLLAMIMIFSTLIWYLLLNCSLRYEVLGIQLKNLGQSAESKNIKISEKQMHINYFQRLKESIDVHLHLREYVAKLYVLFNP